MDTNHCYKCDRLIVGNRASQAWTFDKSGTKRICIVCKRKEQERDRIREEITEQQKSRDFYHKHGEYQDQVVYGIDGRPTRANTH